MIGSPDLLAFTSSEGFGEGDEVQGSAGPPEDLSVPLLPPSHPWSCSALFQRDFILVAEFSEQVGPKPVLTIPDDPRVIGSFDLNHFSVRIMSVDYQASGPVHASHAGPGPRLNFSEDSEVILGDSAEDAFAYVHHLTLYDLQARGMVRPFCMAYVCSDLAKLMENFAELSSCFSRASDSLKTGNRQAFSMELQRKLQELEYVRLTLLQETKHLSAVNGFTEDAGQAADLESVERSISTHRDLLRQVTSYPNRKLKKPDFLPYDPADSLTDPTALPPAEQSPPTPTPTPCRSEHELKPLQELCNDYFLSLTKEQLADTERRLRGDRSVLRTVRVSRSLSRRLALTNFLFDSWSTENEEEEEEEKEVEELPRASQSGVRATCSEPMSLASFYSCVEEIPIKLEAGGTLTSDPGVVTEMAGSVSSSDSIEVLGTEKSYRTQHDVDGSDSREAADSFLSSAETPVMLMDPPLRRVPVDTGARRVRAYARRANSEDSIEVLSTTESIFPDDLTAITEEEAEQQPLSNGFEDEEEEEGRPEEKILNVTGEGGEHGNEQFARREEGDVDEDEPLKDLTVADGVEVKEEPVESWKKNREQEDERTEKTSNELQVHEAVEPMSNSSKVHQMVQWMDLLVNFAPPVAPAESDHWSPPRAPLRVPSIDEASDCTSFTGSSDPPSPTQHIHINPRSDKRRRKAGLRALRFVKHYSFSHHAVFCLLSGRPLVVLGGDESLVRKLVDALSLFLPAPDRNAVMPCLTTPLQLTDLLTWRLIGIHRSPSSSSSSIIHSLSRYSRYLALLDLDQKTLRCPSYSGSLISRMTDPHSGISHGATYLLHLESCLAALVNQALLHTFRPATHRLSTPGLSSSEQDVRVMNFLSELIKQRHAGRGPPVLRFSYSAVQLHRNTYTT